MRWQDDYPSGMLRDASGGGLAPVDGAVLEFQALLKAWVPALVTELGVLSQLLQPLLSRTGKLLLEACSRQQAAGSWQQGSTAPACLSDVRVQPGNCGMGSRERASLLQPGMSVNFCASL